MENRLNREDIQRQQDTLVNHIEARHLRPVNDSDGPVFFISDTYTGVWMEHWYDGVTWAGYRPEYREISRNYIRLFLKHQSEEGQIPCFVLDWKIGYSQVQECVSIGRLCLRAIDQNPQDGCFLSDCYRALCAWDGWLTRKRMTMGTGLIEQFCGYDTGHDNSGRLDGAKYPGNICEDGGFAPTDDAVLPMLAPDMNACFYGDRMALAEMAERLGKKSEAEGWRKKAEDVKKKMFELLFDEKDLFFYDVDKNGCRRPVRSVSLTNVLQEHAVDRELGRSIVKKHLLNPEEFWTPYAFPAVAMNDASRELHHMDNSWGYYSQANTALRTTLWMEHYGFEAEMEQIMEAWLEAWFRSRTTQWGQELHPVTGEPSGCSGWYSSCMLFCLTAMRRLYGIG